jgi:polyisoprenoid-binding protein YceI
MGTFTIDESDPTKSTFSVELTVEKIDTNNDKRNAHLKSPDFFNAKQYPKITFKSTSVKKGQGDNMLEVTGDLTMHGVKKPSTVQVELTGKGEFPPTVKRAGVEANFVVKTSDFEIKGMPGALSDEVKVVVSLEGIKQ